MPVAGYPLPIRGGDTTPLRGVYGTDIVYYIVIHLSNVYVMYCSNHAYTKTHNVLPCRILRIRLRGLGM